MDHVWGSDSDPTRHTTTGPLLKDAPDETMGWSIFGSYFWGQNPNHKLGSLFNSEDQFSASLFDRVLA